MWPPELFGVLSITCEKVTEEWGEVFHEFTKGEGSFWNNVYLSIHSGFSEGRGSHFRKGANQYKTKKKRI